ncbi:hypothetical protein LCGC14_1123930 [marine sediment metagenome]|uniref:Uncharacterized protein n=1 Tax=marine sediment metagenome TaxID=412755 RepID=A0A0F9PLC4_9ZZZZ
MKTQDFVMLKSLVQRLLELSKHEDAEGTLPLSTTADTSVRPFSTESPYPGLSGSHRKERGKAKRPSDYAHGQRGKNEAGRVTRHTSLPAEAANLRVDQPPVETSGYLNHN